MELNWLECLVYGLISGIAEFLPVSAVAHQTVFLKLLGAGNSPLLQLAAHVGALAALLISSRAMLSRLRREWRLHSMPKNRRRRHPDFGILMEMRVFRTGALMVLLVFLSYGFVHGLYERLWLLAILLGINGILLYLPQYLPGANKTAQSLSRLDAVLIGLASGCGVVPGISAVGSGLSVARIRGADKKYSLDLALLLCIPGLFLPMIPEVAAIAVSGMAWSAAAVISCLTVAVASFFSSLWAIVMVRFLAVKASYSGFAYYSWGLALFTLILYLI